MDNKFTPGPWELDDGESDAFGVFSSDGEAICYLSEEPSRGTGLRDRDIDEANARLIAAAPDMYVAIRGIHKELEAMELEACKRAGAMQRFSGYDIINFITIKLYPIIGNALAKAEGKEA